MKKHSVFRFLLPAALAAVLALCLCASASAEGERFHDDASGQIIQCGGMPSGLTGRATYSQEAEDAVCEAIDNVEDCIYLYPYRLTRSTLYDLMVDVCNGHGEFFYLAGSWSFDYRNGYIDCCYPDYETYDKDISVMKAELKNAAERAAAYARKCSSPVLQVMLANDYLCDHMTYDYTYQHYDSYSALVEGCAVCQGYTEAYEVIMNVLGIPNTYAVSESMCHIWNLVKLDGSWYHVDTTWDDNPGCYHTFFLRSDSALPEHYGWTSSVKATSTKYDDYFWIDLDDKLPVFDDSIYFITSSDYTRTINRWDASTEKTGSVFSFKAKWVEGADPNAAGSWSYSAYLGCLAVISGRVYYVVPDGVMSVSVSGGKSRREMTVPANSGSIYRSSFSGVTLSYTLGTSYSELTDSYTWSFDENGVHHYAGGVNGVCVDCGQSFPLDGLTVTTLPDSLTRLGKGSFSNTVAQVIVVPESCSGIGAGAFGGITALEYLFLPDALEDTLSRDALEGVNAVVIYYHE